jgi:hypothetical protein
MIMLYQKRYFGGGQIWGYVRDSGGPVPNLGHALVVPSRNWYSMRMDENEVSAIIYVDLMTAEQRAISERHAVTQRAALYMETTGYPLVKVLEALKISRTTWYRRLTELRDWQAGNRAAGDRAVKTVGNRRAAEFDRIMARGSAGGE